jgi:microcystin degradation protein MlrC
MRLLTGQIYQETNSFSPILATLDFFTDHVYLEGEEIPKRLKGINTEIAGFIDVIQKEKCDPIYTIAAQSVTSGSVKKDAMDYIIRHLLEHIEKAGKIDGVYLALHGAMLTEETNDASGLVLQHVREKIGESIPLVCSVDLHANLTPLMVKCADALDAYRTFPHTDFKQVGARSTEILIKIIKKEIVPKMAFCTEIM